MSTTQRAVSAILGQARADAEGDDKKFDAVMDSLKGLHKRMDDDGEERKKDRARLDDVCSRMDSFDTKAKADAEEKERADKARKDAEEKDEKEKEEKTKADAARKDAEEKEAAEKAKADKARADAAAAAGGNADILKTIADLQRQMPAQLSGEDRVKFSASQELAHKIAMAFGDSEGAPPPLNGETLPEYRRRLLRPYKQHSKDWKDVDLTTINDAALAVAETKIYADAQQAAEHPTDLPEGVLRKVTRVDQAGRTIHSFVGSDEAAAWRPFMFPTRNLGKWLPRNRE
jgi:hypothetical protein